MAARSIGQPLPHMQSAIMTELVGEILLRSLRAIAVVIVPVEDPFSTAIAVEVAEQRTPGLSGNACDFHERPIAHREQRDRSGMADTRPGAHHEQRNR